MKWIQKSMVVFLHTTLCKRKPRDACGTLVRTHHAHPLLIGSMSLILNTSDWHLFSLLASFLWTVKHISIVLVWWRSDGDANLPSPPPTCSFAWQNWEHLPFINVTYPISIGFFTTVGVKLGKMQKFESHALKLFLKFEIKPLQTWEPWIFCKTQKF